MRNVLGENNHGTGCDLLSLLIELEFKFTIENAKELVFMTMHMQRHAGSRRRYGFKDKILSFRLTTRKLECDFVAEHEKLSFST